MTQSDDTTHECPKVGCARRVPFHQLACAPHWYQVPGPIRRAVWSAYRDKGIGSPEHGAAIRAAIGAMNGEH